MKKALNTSGQHSEKPTSVDDRVFTRSSKHRAGSSRPIGIHPSGSNV